MPAVPEEIEEAEKEGVKFEFLVAPVRIIGDHGKVSRIEMMRMAAWRAGLERQKKTGPGERVQLYDSCNTMISSIGEEPDLSFLPYSFLKKRH